MITLSHANRLHSILIKEFGGSDGIRDNESLLSALIRPFQSFEGKELYPTPVEKAAAIIESIL